MSELHPRHLPSIRCKAQTSAYKRKTEVRPKKSCAARPLDPATELALGSLVSITSSPTGEDVLYEVVNGEIVELAPMGAYQVWIGPRDALSPAIFSYRIDSKDSLREGTDFASVWG